MNPPDVDKDNDMTAPFVGNLEYDVTDRGIIGTKTLTLEPEEAVLAVECCCFSTLSRRPYGELGSVDRGKYCCCVGFSSELTGIMGNSIPICPGMGCDNHLTSSIVEELKRRMRLRGDTGNLLRAEENTRLIKALQADVSDMNRKVDALLRFHRIADVTNVMKPCST